MSEFLINDYGDYIYYNLKSYINNLTENINFYFECENQRNCWIRPHRENGPAIIYTDGGEDYCIHGKYHRDDGPAVICPDGYIEWWLDGTFQPFKDWCKKLNKSGEEIAYLKLKWNVNE